MRKEKKKMKEAIKVSKIEIQIGKNILELSIEEARGLKKILNDTFPEIETLSVEGVRCDPQPPPYPVYITTYPSYYPGWGFTYSNAGSTLCLSTG